MSQYLIIPIAERLEESLKLAECYGLGFEFNDFCLPDVLDDEEGVQKRIAFYREQMPCGMNTMHGAFYDIAVFSMDERIRRVCVERIEQSLQIAQRLGVKGVVFHSNLNPMLTAETYREGFVEANVKVWRALTGKYPDIQIYLENMFDKAPTEIVRIAEALRDVKNFGVTLDYAHACIYGNDIEGFVRALAPYIRHVHINDNDGVNDLHLPVGSGVIDWKQFRVLKEKYFADATILIETSSIEEQKASLQYMEENAFICRKQN